MAEFMEFTVNPECICNPEFSLAYNQPYLEVEEWAILGFGTFTAYQDAIAEDMEFHRVNNGATDDDIACAMAEEDAYGRIGDIIDELSVPGFTVTGWESHAHKDALGLVTLYFRQDTMEEDDEEE